MPVSVAPADDFSFSTALRLGAVDALPFALFTCLAGKGERRDPLQFVPAEFAAIPEKGAPKEIRTYQVETALGAVGSETQADGTPIADG